MNFAAPFMVSYKNDEWLPHVAACSGAGRLAHSLEQKECPQSRFLGTKSSSSSS